MGEQDTVTQQTAGESTEGASNFIHELIDEDNHTRRFEKRVHTRFPPEPNGYLHIGHAMSINLNYGLARDYGGKFNFRFDDTNPTKEEQEYVDSIIADVRWIGADWEDRLFFASDYFDQLYEWAVKLIKDGKAYVDDLSGDQIREYRGTLTTPGKESPYRNRPVEENLDLFERMKKGEFPDGAKVLRAKIDIQSCTASATPSITARGTSGASTRCTITRTGSLTRLSGLPTRSARLNTRITVRCMIGIWISWAFTTHSRLSLPG
jgi:glutamyl/glutaminyl-tRNA synthetase